MRWPWSSRRPEPERTPDSHVASEVAREPRGEWRTLPALQRIVDPPSSACHLDTFGDSLATHQDPRFLEPLGHHVDAAAPSGEVADLARPVAPVRTEFPLRPQLSQAVSPSAQRTADSTTPPAPASGPTSAPVAVPAPPPLLSPTPEPASLPESDAASGPAAEPAPGPDAEPGADPDPDPVPDPVPQVAEPPDRADATTAEALPEPPRVATLGADDPQQELGIRAPELPPAPPPDHPERPIQRSTAGEAAPRTTPPGPSVPPGPTTISRTVPQASSSPAGAPTGPPVRTVPVVARAAADPALRPSFPEPVPRPVAAAPLPILSAPTVVQRTEHEPQPSDVVLPDPVPPAAELPAPASEPNAPGPTVPQPPVVLDLVPDRPPVTAETLTPPTVAPPAAPPGAPPRAAATPLQRSTGPGPDRAAGPPPAQRTPSASPTSPEPEPLLPPPTLLWPPTPVGPAAPAARPVPGPGVPTAAFGPTAAPAPTADHAGAAPAAAPVIPPAVQPAVQRAVVGPLRPADELAVPLATVAPDTPRSATVTSPSRPPGPVPPSPTPRVQRSVGPGSPPVAPSYDAAPVLGRAPIPIEPGPRTPSTVRSLPLQRMFSETVQGGRSSPASPRTAEPPVRPFADVTVRLREDVADPAPVPPPPTPAPTTWLEPTLTSVQRTEEAVAATDASEASDASGPAGSGAAAPSAAGVATALAAVPATAPAAPGQPGSGPDLDELARRLYAPMSAMLRAELWLDRERSGRSLAR